MDPLSTSASILAIATAGIQISIKLAVLANQIQTAPKRITTISDDISATSGVLQELGHLMGKTPTKKSRTTVSIFNDAGLKRAESLSSACQRIFADVEAELKNASKQMKSLGIVNTVKIVLSGKERLLWPFLQLRVDALVVELREAKITLMLMLQVTTLGYSRAIVEKYAQQTTSLVSWRVI